MEFISIVIVLGLSFIAWWRILPRIGWSRRLSVLFAFSVIPVIGLIPILVLAYLRWPIDQYIPGAAGGYSQARGPSMSEQERETTNCCTNCGKPNAVADRICGSCGKDL